MKLKNIFGLLVGAVAILLTGCEPIEDRDSLVNNSTVEGVDIVAAQSTAGGNEITLKLNTPGVTGYWEHALGRAFTDEKTVIYPAKGTFDFTFVGTLGSEFFEKTISATIDNLDTPVPEEWGLLLGDDAVGGKTWVLALDRPAGIEPFADSPNLCSFMVANYDWLEFWWDPFEGTHPEETAEMLFDLNGGTNYTHSFEGETTAAKFQLDTDAQTLKVTGANLIDANGGGNLYGDFQDGLYQIKKLTDTELVLCQIHSGYGWIWIFKPKGHEYE